MKTPILLFLFLLYLTGSNAQGLMPPSIWIEFQEQKIEGEVFKHQYNFMIQPITGGIKKNKMVTTPIDFKSSSYSAVYDYGLRIDLETITAQHEHLYPKKGDVAGMYIQDIKSGKTMRLFIRFCHDLYRGAEIPLRGLEFREGAFFYDMCHSQPKYQVMFKALCPEHFQPGEYVFDPFLELGNYETHKVRLSKLNKILKKYDCHD